MDQALPVMVLICQIDVQNLNPLPLSVLLNFGR